ncbi:MAG TPA: hypothetical protein VKL40_06220 [Candidatus Angelobacter sp.]|nr:hypothetical protein [Candidatus Angelobacter sp.]
MNVRSTILYLLHTSRVLCLLILVAAQFVAKDSSLRDERLLFASLTQD